MHAYVLLPNKPKCQEDAKKLRTAFRECHS